MQVSLKKVLASYDDRAPLAEASTIPAPWYVDPRIAELERQNVFGRTWQLVARTDQLRKPGEFVSTLIAGEPVVALHTPGHSPDHLVFWHERSRTAFTGDLVIPGSSVTIHTGRGGNLAEYLQSVERVRSLRPARLLPAHGPESGSAEQVLTQVRRTPRR